MEINHCTKMKNTHKDYKSPKLSRDETPTAISWEHFNHSATLRTHKAAVTVRMIKYTMTYGQVNYNLLVFTHNTSLLLIENKYFGTNNQ